MDFRVNEDQEALRDGLRSFCEGRFPLDQLGALATKPFNRAVWRELAEMGVFALRLPEAKAGLALGMAEAVLVFAELGRRLVPGPLVWSHLAAELIPGAASGEVVVGGLDRMLPSSDPVLVESLDALDVLLVLRQDGVRRLDPRTLRAEPVATPLDPLTPLHVVSELGEGERIAGPEVAAQWRLAGGALVAGQLFGIAEATQELATAYAKTREQFGRPIGSFQAIKHILADTFVRQELARAAAYAAGATLDHPRPPGGGGADAGRLGREAGRRGRRTRERARLHPGARRHGVHLGNALPLLPEAQLGAGRAVRQRRGAQRAARPARRGGALRGPAGVWIGP